MHAALLFLSLISVCSASWSELTCNNGQECSVKFSGLRFEGAVLHMTIQNTLNSPVVGGETTLHTEGYGCFFFLCDWVEGPAMTNSTCDYTALECSSEGLLLQPRQTKEVSMDFTPAVKIAGSTTGCCSVDPYCDCMLKGVAVMKNPMLDEYARVEMSFKCDFQTLECSL